MYHTATGLMGGEYQHFGYLNMGWGTGGIEGHIGNVCPRERSDAFIHIVGTLVVAMESHVAEVGFHQSRFEIRHSHCECATSILSPSVMAFTADLVAQYTLPPAYAASPATEPMLMT